MLWLRPGSHLLQLAPYGWSPDGVTLIRGQYFEEAANATRITYRCDVIWMPGRSRHFANVIREVVILELHHRYGHAWQIWAG